MAIKINYIQLIFYPRVCSDFSTEVRVYFTSEKFTFTELNKIPFSFENSVIKIRLEWCYSRNLVNLLHNKEMKTSQESPLEMLNELHKYFKDLIRWMKHLVRMAKVITGKQEEQSNIKPQNVRSHPELCKIFTFFWSVE